MANIKEIDVKQVNGSYDTQTIGVDAVNVDINATITLADKVSVWDAKQDAVSGKGLSTEDYTTLEKNKLATIEAYAQENVIESVSVNGSVLPIVDKTVDIGVSGDYAPTDHASSTTQYGAATSENYGHVKFGATAGTAVEGNDSRLSDARTPVAHAAADSTYGLASASLYGHAKVVSVTSANSDSAAAASAQSVYDALAGKADNMSYNTSTGDLDLKSGNTVLATVTIEGGGMSGSMIIITDDELLHGETVTATLNGSETLEATFSEYGIAAFTPNYTGTYTISCNGYSTTVTVTEVGLGVAESLHVPKSIITVSTATSSWYNSDVTLSYGGSAIETKTLNGSSTTFKVYNTGTYTATMQGKSDTFSVSTLDTNYSITINEAVLVSWSTGTDAEIAAMIDAYYEGVFSLAQVKSVWSIGDTRSITLSAMSATGVGESHRSQTVELEILDFDHDTLTTSKGGKTKALITVDQKNCLRDASVSDTSGSSNTENGYMNSSDTNSGGWTNCARRTWCNNVYYAALPDYLKNRVQYVNKLTSAGSQSSTINTTSDRVWLLSEIEIFGSTTYSFAGEGTQYPHFANATANRYKLPKWNSSGVSGYWWERSPRSSTSTYFCFVSVSGGASSYYASSSCGLAPAMAF